MVDLKRRLEEDAKLLQQLQEQVCADGSRLEEHEQRLRAVRTSMEQQVELSQLEARDTADRLRADMADEFASKLRECGDKMGVNIETLSSRLDEHRDAHEALRQQLLIRAGRDIDKLDSSALSANGFAQDEVSEIAAELSLCSQGRSETRKGLAKASVEERARNDSLQEDLLLMRTRVELVEARLGSVVEQQLDRTEQPQASDTLAVASRDLYKVVSKVAEHEETLQALVERSTVVQVGLTRMSEQLRNHVEELQALAQPQQPSAPQAEEPALPNGENRVNGSATELREANVLSALDTFESRLAMLKDVLDMETNTRLDLDPRVTAVEARNDALQHELQEVVAAVQALTRLTAEAAEARGSHTGSGHSKADAAAGIVDPVKEDLAEIKGILREVMPSKELTEGDSVSRRTSLARASFVTAMDDCQDPEAQGTRSDKNAVADIGATPASRHASPTSASNTDDKAKSPESPRQRLMSVRTFVGGTSAGERHLDSVFAAEAVKRRSMFG